MSLSVRLVQQLPGIELSVDFEAPSGVTVLFGRSGSGKTTVVNAVAGLLRPDAGRVAIGDWVLFDTSRALKRKGIFEQISFLGVIQLLSWCPVCCGV